MQRLALVLGAATACAAALLAACLVSIDDSQIIRDAGPAIPEAAPADAASDAPADAPVDAYDGGCPAGMILIPVTADVGAPYCVDSTEVTFNAYGAFVDAAEPPAPGSQRAECDWNTSFKPLGWGNGTTGTRPATGLDWCDAVAYCAWAGKRLCGAIGGGAVSPSGGATNPPESQWFYACSSGGTRRYPYGDTYDAATCLGADSIPTPSGAQPVGKASACVGGFDGLLDMSGNAEEFLDSCSTEKLCDGGHECELCILIGGGFHDHGDRLDCAYVNLVTRNGQYDDNGVRCCWP